MPNVRIHKTKTIRSLSKTRSGGEVISPTKALRKLKVGHFLIVDDDESRHHMLTAAVRLNISITTRRTKDGRYEVHRIAKVVEHPLFEYPL